MDEDEARPIGRRVLLRLWEGHEPHAGVIVDPPHGMLLPDALVCIQFNPPLEDRYNPGTWIVSLITEASMVTFATDEE